VTIDFDKVRREYSLRDAVARYIDIRQKGKSLVGLCPFHDDHNPSFNIYRAKDGIERYRCFSCLENGDIVDFIAAIEHCEPAEAVRRITGDTLPLVGTYVRQDFPHDDSDEWTPIFPVPVGAPPYRAELTFKPANGQTRDWSKIMERQDAYYDEEGQLLFWVVKLRFPNGSKACPQVCYCQGPGGQYKWAAKRSDPPHPLMGLDDLARYPKRHVMLLSGERCRSEHANFSEKFVAVTWLGGDQAVEDTDWSPLFGRKVTYYSDDDESGVNAMRRIYEIVEIEKHGSG
jgi:hypothetical protein